jgi:hypothetical protein
MAEEEGALHLEGNEGSVGGAAVSVGASTAAAAAAAASDGLLPVPPQFSVATIIVTNISPLATERDLRDFFANCGNIVQLNILGFRVPPSCPIFPLALFSQFEI